MRDLLLAGLVFHLFLLPALLLKDKLLFSCSIAAIIKNLITLLLVSYVNSDSFGWLRKFQLRSLIEVQRLIATCVVVRKFLLFSGVHLSLFLALFGLTHLHVCLNSGSWLLPCFVWFLYGWSRLLPHSASNLAGHLWSVFYCLRLICQLVDCLIYWVNWTQLVHVVAIGAHALLFISQVVSFGFIVGVLVFSVFLLWLGFVYWLVLSWLLDIGGIGWTTAWDWIGLVTAVALQWLFDFIFS